jgi:hypothetical protein
MSETDYVLNIPTTRGRRWSNSVSESETDHSESGETSLALRDALKSEIAGLVSVYIS